GEFLTGFSEGRPLFARTTDCEFNLANFMRSVVYSSMGALKVGMDILAEEGVAVDRMVGHGGLFKTEGVAEQYLADAIHAPVTVLDTAGEGGAWGIAVLAAFMAVREEKETLPEFLNAKIFPGMQGHTAEPKAEQSEGFEKFMELYRAALPVERAAVESMK
ncbi:MAG: ATPase, partial [Stomatobaculum sp.]|nr:ATPase [Stomatobaculum sp.]